MRVRFLPIIVLSLALPISSCARPADPQQAAEPQTSSDDTTGDQKPTQSAQAPPNSRPARETAVETAAQPLAGPPEFLSREELDGGWIKLFDGQTLFGWKPNSNANWTVDGGVIKADSGDAGLLVTTAPWADYELHLEYRLSKGGNSAVFLRSPFAPKDAAVDCYELNFCDTHPEYPTGGLVGRQKASRTVIGDGDWRKVVVRANGPRIEAEFDGEPAVEFNDTSPNVRSNGFIGLQMKDGSIEFRNIRIRPLETQVIFNGEDLSGWHEVPGSKSKFAVADGTIHVANGPGFLESDRKWGDFVLQVEARTNGTALNSGIFFRAMPGTESAPSNGYELQIQNAAKDGDRAQPVDFGTGAIFRRQKVRWVVPDDNEWFSMTLVASGDHFSAWVDGLQVTDWTDTRAAHENPRQGRRLEPGHLSLQGHDATTDLNFRNIRIADLPASP